jgi:hypothetical protein
VATGGIERKSKQIFTDCDPENKQWNKNWK